MVHLPPDFPFTERPGLRVPAEYDRLYRNLPLAPVTLRGGRAAVAVTRYEDVRTVLSDPRFSREAFDGNVLFARDRSSLALAASDPPDHTRRRRAVTSAFTARRARESRPGLELLAKELLAGLRAAGPPADLVDRYAYPFPIAVMCDLLGIPFADRDRFRAWGDAMMSITRYSPAEVAAAHRQMHEYVAQLVATAPTCLLAELTGVAELSREEVVVLGAGLLIAGYETTANQLAICLFLLLRDPALMTRVRREPAVIPAVVEEMLRWTSFLAGGGPPHVALEDTPLGGTVVPAGQVVVPLIDAANRDPEVFTDPDALVPDRPAAHLAFGHGRHHCLGAHLARAELQVAIGCLVAEFPDIELVGGARDINWRSGMALRGLWELPVRWEDNDGQ